MREVSDLLPCEIQPSLLLTLDRFDESIEVKEVGDVPIDSKLRFFSIEKSDREATASISREYKQAGHGAEFFISDAVVAAIAKLKDNLTDRFSDFSSKVTPRAVCMMTKIMVISKLMISATVFKSHWKAKGFCSNISL